MTESLSDLRCVVLGAGGFLGSNLCRHLRGRGAQVRAFGRRMSFPDALVGMEWLPGQFEDTNTVAAAISGCDVAFHLINTSTPASANADKVADLQANVAATLRFLDACKAERVGRVVFVSSGGTVYGIPDQIPTPETAQTDPITAYGVSKLAVEKYLHVYEHLHGLPYRVLRVANPFGPYQTALKNQGVVAAFLKRALENRSVEIWGDGGLTRDYVYVADVCAALVRAVEHAGPERVFNIGSGVGRSLDDVVAAIGLEIGHFPKVERRPGRPVDVPRSVLDISRAESQLDWRPVTSFSEGIRRTAAWMRGRE